MGTKVYETFCEIETSEIGEILAQRIKPGDIVAFYGDLGAGKTAFVKGLAKGLGCADAVSSPTFSLVNHYKGDIDIYHFDMYRIETEDELYSIGFYDYLGYENAVYAIEWIENVESYIPEAQYSVCIEKIGENSRRITLRGECF